MLDVICNAAVSHPSVAFFIAWLLSCVIFREKVTR